LYIGRLEVGKIQPVFGRVMLPVVIYDVLESFCCFDRTFGMSRSRDPEAGSVETTRQSFEAQASTKNIELKAEIPENFPEKIWADEDAIKHILENLISNAIKFTDSGGTVTVELNDISQEFIEIRVCDTGCGISKDQIPLIFEKYYRAEEYKTKGTGLGLAIVKRLVELHHGEIEVESCENVGSTFIVKLPKNPKS
jgi:signal transduction histidine kinase